MELLVPARRTSNPEVAFIALGANLGDRAANLAQAVALLASHPFIALLQTSSLYQSEPVGIVDQPLFLNAVAALRTALEPCELLAYCQELELRMGRVRDRRWGPRVLDLDLLLYGERTMQLPSLCLPHPRMWERPFVFEPLWELRDWLTPALREKASEVRQGSGRSAALECWRQVRWNPWQVGER